MDRETDRWMRLIKEINWIRKTAPTINRDKRGYKLSHLWERGYSSS